MEDLKTASGDEPQTQDQSTYENVKFRSVPSREKEGNISFTKTFHIEYTDPDTETLHTGQMTVRRLSIGAVSELGVVQARLNGGLNVHPDVAFMNQMIAYCSVAIVNAPDWWNPLESFDVNLLRAVWSYIRSWEDSFRLGMVARRRGQAATTGGSSA